MNVSCSQCGRQYAIDDGRLRGRRVQFRCAKCQAVIPVGGVPPASEPTPSADALPEGSGAEWFLLVRGMQVGPLDLPGLLERARTGQLTARSFVWREGQGDWKRVGDVAALEMVLASVGTVDTTPRPQAGSPPLQGLFSDLDLTVSRPMDGSAIRRALAQATGSDMELLREPKNRSARSRGVDGLTPIRREPPWKRGLGVVAAVLIPLSVLYILAALRIVPLEVVRIDARGQNIREPLLSTRGLAALFESPRAAPPPPARARSPEHPAPLPTVAPAAARPVKAVLPAVSPPPVEKSAPRNGPSPAEQARVVDRARPSFGTCIEPQLRKTPRLRGGHLTITATVAPSGAVTRVALDRPDLAQSSLAECLRARVRRLTFPPFDGAAVEVAFPIVLERP